MTTPPPYGQQPHDPRITGNPEYARSYEHYLSQGSTPDEAARLAYDWTASKFPPDGVQSAGKRRKGLVIAGAIGGAVLVVCCGGGIIAALNGGGDSNKTTASSSKAPITVQSVSPAPSPTPSPSPSPSPVVTHAPPPPKPAPPAPKPKPKAATIPGDGTFIPGTDFPAGTYRSSGGTDGMCYWARLRDLSGQIPQGIISNGNPTGPAVVRIRASDAGFQTQGCGDWTKIG